MRQQHFLRWLSGIWAVCLLFTFRPPELAIFIDPVTGTRGIG